MRALILVVAVALLGCGSDKKKDGDDGKKTDEAGDTAKRPADDTAKKPADDTAKKPADDPAKKPADDTAKKPAGDPARPAPVTLVDVSQGDMGCYLEIEDKDGESRVLLGGFDLCPEGEADASKYVGERVHVKMAKESVPAGTCEGDPECTDTEEVEVVTEVSAADVLD